MATSSMDTQGTAEEDSDDAEESPTHYLPNGIYSLEALRFPGLFLDAFQDPREKNGKAELRLSLDTDVAKMSLGNDNGAAWGWPFFRARRVTAPGSYTFESMRYPGAFLCTSDMKVLGMKPADWGSVKLVLNPKQDEHKTWFQLKRVKGRENFSQRRDKTEHVYTVSSVKYRRDSGTITRAHSHNTSGSSSGLHYHSGSSSSGSGGHGFLYYLDAYDGGAYSKLKAQYGQHASPTHGVKSVAANLWGSMANRDEGFWDGRGRVRLCKVDSASTRHSANGSSSHGHSSSASGGGSGSGSSGAAAAKREKKWGVNALGEALPAGAPEPPGYRWEWWRLRRYVVSLVFTDIQGSTRLWERFGPKFKAIIDMHHRILRACLRRHHGYEVKTEGDAFMIAFTSPSDAVLFGTELQTDLIDYPWPSWLIEDSDVQDLVGTFYLANNNKTTDGAPATTDTIPIAPELFALGLAPAEAGDATTGDDGGESKAVKGTSPEEERATRSEKPEGWGVGMQPPGAALLKRGSLRANKEDLGVLAKNVEPWLSSTPRLHDLQFHGQRLDNNTTGAATTTSLAQLLATGGMSRVAELAVAPTPAAVLHARSGSGAMSGDGLTLESQGLFPEVAAALVVAAEAEAASALAAADSAGKLETVLVSFGAGPLGLRFKGLAVDHHSGTNGDDDSHHHHSLSERASTFFHHHHHSSDTPSKQRSSVESVPDASHSSGQQPSRPVSIDSIPEVKDGTELYRDNKSHRRVSGLGGGVGLPDDARGSFAPEQQHHNHAGGGGRSSSASRTSNASNAKLTGGHRSSAMSNMSHHLSMRMMHSRHSHDDSATNMVIVGFATVGEGPSPPEASGRVFLGDLLAEVRPYGASADDPATIKLAGLPYSAALDALDNAPFPCTLVLKRLPALAASIAANQRLALPKPLYRGLRVRVGCFTGAPEAERDPVTKRMDFYGPAVNRAARVEGQADGGQFLICESTYLHTVGYRPDEDRGILDFGLTGHIQGSNYLRASTAVVDCGVRDLKGIARPEHVYQVLPERLRARSFASTSSSSAPSLPNQQAPSSPPALPAAAAPPPASNTTTPKSQTVARPPTARSASRSRAPTSSSSSSSLSPPPPPSRTPHRARGTSLDSAQTALIVSPSSNNNNNSRSLQGTFTGNSASSASFSQPTNGKGPLFITGANDAVPLVALLVEHLNSRGFQCFSALATYGDSTSDPVASGKDSSISGSNNSTVSKVASNGNGEAASQAAKSSSAEQRRADQLRSSRCLVAVLSPGIVELPYTPPESYDDDDINEVTDPKNATENNGMHTPTAAEAAAAAAFWADVSVACASHLPMVVVQLEGSTWLGKPRLNPKAAYVPANMPALGSAAAATTEDSNGSDSSSSGGVGTVAVRPLLDALLANGPPLGHSSEYLEPFLDRLSRRCLALVGSSSPSSGNATVSDAVATGDGHRNTSKGIRKMLASPENGARQQRKSRTRKQAK